MRSVLTAVIAVAVLGTVAGCSRGSGRIVGFLVNGVTGARINIFQDDGAQKNLSDDDATTKNVYAIIDGEFVRAEPCGAGDATEENKISAEGCYTIPEVPEGIEIPLFADVDGMEHWQTHTSLALRDSDNREGDGQKVGNIRLFPRGFQAAHRVHVSVTGTGVKATVSCQLSNATDNTLATEGNFLQPESTTTAAIVGDTDDSGDLALDPAQLVLGGAYKCEAFSLAPINGQALTGQATFVAGVSKPEVVIGLGTGYEPLYIVRSNIDDPKDVFGDNATIQIIFNRSVEFVPRTLDSQVASVSTVDYDGDGKTMSLKANEPGNNASETVNASISGDGLTLTLGYKGVVNAADPDDIGTSVVFSGIKVRPTGRDDSLSQKDVGSIKNLRTGSSQSLDLNLF